MLLAKSSAVPSCALWPCDDAMIACDFWSAEVAAVPFWKYTTFADVYIPVQFVRWSFLFLFMFLSGFMVRCDWPKVWRSEMSVKAYHVQLSLTGWFFAKYSVSSQPPRSQRVIEVHWRRLNAIHPAKGKSTSWQLQDFTERFFDRSRNRHVNVRGKWWRLWRRMQPMTPRADRRSVPGSQIGKRRTGHFCVRWHKR